MLIPKWVGLCISRTLWISPTNSPVRLGVSHAASTPTGFSQPEVFEALFHCAGTLGCMVSLPSCSFWFICMQVWDHRVLQLLPCCQYSPPWLLALPLLPVWLNVSSLTPWLLDFHTVQFSGSSGYFFLFKFVLLLLLVVQGGKVYLPTPPS